MQHRDRLLIAITLALLLLVAIFVIVSLRTKPGTKQDVNLSPTPRVTYVPPISATRAQASPTVSTGTVYPSVPASIPEAEVLEVRGVAVKNFYKDAVEINAAGDVLFDESQDQRLLYFPKYESFLVRVMGEPTNEKLHKVENSFLENLGITEQDACLLNATVNYENPERLQGVPQGNFNLSFCDH